MWPGMFAARGFNIDSLVVGRTENPDVSRMTIVIHGDDQMLDQVRKQLSKLVEVIQVVDYSDAAYVERDLMLARIGAPSAQRRDVIELADLFRANVVDVGHEELMVELSGTEDKLEAFVELVRPFGIVELARTGVIAMPRSEKTPGMAPDNSRAVSSTRAPRRSAESTDDGM
jgi:acetolactate synthase-1/3 small subunit